MEWKPTWTDPLTRYVAPYHDLIGDKGTRTTFDETIRGIMGAGSLICQQIAAHAAVLAQGKKGAQRVIRLVSGESTLRSDLDAQQLTRKLREAAVESLEQAPEEEVWLVAECSDLRKPYATEMPYLMQVPALEGKGLVPGYRTLPVLGITPGRRGILPKRQPVKVDIAVCPMQLTYATGGRRKAPGELVSKELWLVQVQVLGTTQAPWWLLTDWPEEDEQSAMRIFIMYRERWAAEDSFKVPKECLGWEEVRGLDWQALQTLVALAWVTAGFLYQMGVAFQWAEVPLIAKLGGWEAHKDRKPGKITLMRGLSRLVEMLATQAILSRSATEHEGLPPNIAAFLQGWSPPDEL